MLPENPNIALDRLSELTERTVTRLLYDIRMTRMVDLPSMLMFGKDNNLGRQSKEANRALSPSPQSQGHPDALMLVDDSADQRSACMLHA